MQKVIAFLVKKVITVVMIVFSFFIKGDMTKVEMHPEEQVKAGASSATFIFENKTGKTLDLHIYVESVEMEKNGKWEEVPYVQMLDDVDFVNPPHLHPGEKTDITVEFKQRAVYSEPVPMPLAAGNYRITVSYKTIGYNTVQEGKQTFNFTVTPA